MCPPAIQFLQETAHNKLAVLEYSALSSFMLHANSAHFSFLNGSMLKEKTFHCEPSQQWFYWQQRRVSRDRGSLETGPPQLSLLAHRERLALCRGGGQTANP